MAKFAVEAQRIQALGCQFHEISQDGWRGWCYLGGGMKQAIVTKDAKIARQIAEHWERIANQLETRQSFEKLHLAKKSSIIIPSYE